jgi:hypothetical protein
LGNTEVVSAEIDARSLYAKPFPMNVNLDKVSNSVVRERRRRRRRRKRCRRAANA